MIVVWILTVVLVLVFVASGGMKVLGLPYSERNRDRFGISPSLWRAVGVLELTGAVGLLAGIAVAALGVAAGVGLALLMVGATATRLRVHDPVVQVLGDLVVLALVVLYVVVRL